MDPLGHVIVGFLFLQAFQNNLVFASDFHKLSLACLSVETFLKLKVSSAAHALHLERLLLWVHGLGSVHGREMSVCVGDALRVLQNVCHLLE